MRPEPSEIKAVMAYIGDEAGEEVYAPTVSLSELEEELGFDPANTLVYLRDRDVAVTASTASELYVSLDSNLEKAREFAEEVHEEYSGSFSSYAASEHDITFIDYPSSQDIPDPDEIRPHVPQEDMEEVLETVSD